MSLHIVCLIICQKHYPKMVVKITSLFASSEKSKKVVVKWIFFQAASETILYLLIALSHISVMYFDVKFEIWQKKLCQHSSPSLHSFSSHCLLKHSERETTILHSFHNQAILYPNTSQSNRKMLQCSSGRKWTSRSSILWLTWHNES